jgi:hypothetical protein
MRRLLPSRLNSRLASPSQRRRAWLALWAQNQRRARREPVLSLVAGALNWSWPWADPAGWDIYQSHDGGVTFVREEAGWPGNLREYAPADGTLPTFLVGVNAGGNEVTARSNLVQPAPWLRAEYPSALAWDWDLANPDRWHVWMSLDGGGTWTLLEDYWAPGAARTFAPDGGSQKYFVVGVDAAGREVTGRSNVVRPDDAVAPLLEELVAYWDGDAELDATLTQLLLPVENPTYGATGGPGGGPSCALGEADFVYSDDAAFFHFDAMTINVWVQQNEEFGVEHISARTADGADASYFVFTALDIQSLMLGYYWDFGTGLGTGWLPLPVTIGSGQWHMVTLVQDAAALKCYFNGALAATLERTEPAARLAGTSFRVKSNHPWGVWSGAWANLGLWHRVLDATEIATLYNEGDGRTYGELTL